MSRYGIREICVPVLVPEVGRGKKYLPDGAVVLAEKPVVGVHKLALPDGCGRLLGGYVFGPAAERQFADAHSYGSARDNNDLVSGVCYVGYGFAYLFGAADVEPSARVCQGGRPYFNNYSHMRPPSGSGYYLK